MTEGDDPPLDMSIKAIYFDLFHTLVDVGAVPLEQGDYTADILGLPRDQWNDICFSEHHPICEPTEHHEVIRTLAHQLDPTISMAQIDAAHSARQRRFDYALIHVEETLLEGLLTLRQRGIKLGLISNASSGEVAAWPHSPLAALFDHALFSCDCGLRKPQTEIYTLALSTLGVKAHEALFVGDGGSDEHIGARKAGLRPILSRRFIHDSKKLAQQRLCCDGEIEHPEELLRWLDG